MARLKARRSVLQGTLDVLVLQALSRGRMHSAGVAEWLADRATGTLEIRDTTVLQSLYRLEARRFIAGEWGSSPSNRRARFYRVTAAGKLQLRRERESWRRYARLMDRILATSSSTHLRRKRYRTAVLQWERPD